MVQDPSTEVQGRPIAIFFGSPQGVPDEYSHFVIAKD
jgi:hypothetical protein